MRFFFCISHNGLSITKSTIYSLSCSHSEKFNLSAAEAEVKFHNIRAAYGRYLKRLKTLPSRPKTDVFGGFEADDDVA